MVTLANGYEERNTPWAHSRRRYDAGVAMRSLDDIETLIAFFEARRGQLHGFRWKDWTDYKSCGARAEPAYRDQVIGPATTDARPSSWSRPIARAIRLRAPHRQAGAGTVRVGSTAMSSRRACITRWTTTHGPRDLRASAQRGGGDHRRVRVRRARAVRHRSIQTSVASFQAGDVPNVPVVEIRV